MNQASYLRSPDTLEALWVTSAKLPVERRKLVRASLLRDLGLYLHRERQSGFELHRLAIAQPELENLSWTQALKLPMVDAEATPPILEVAQALVKSHPALERFFGRQVTRPDRQLDLWILVWCTLARWNLWALESPLALTHSLVGVREAESALWPVGIALWSEPVLGTDPMTLRQWWFVESDQIPQTLWQPSGAHWRLAGEIV